MKENFIYFNDPDDVNSGNQNTSGFFKKFLSYCLDNQC